MEIKLGQIIPRSAVVARDAIHIAVYPVVAGYNPDTIPPGALVAIDETGKAVLGNSGNAVGVADPFLAGDICNGERFWLFLKPGTVTNLHHVWDHPKLVDDTITGDKPEYYDDCRGCD